MKRTLAILIMFCVAVLAAYVFSPLWGSSDQAVSQTLTRAAAIFVLVPLGLFFALHPTAHLDKKTKERIDLLLGLGGITAVLALVLFGRAIYVPALIATLLLFMFLYFARRSWLRAVLTPRQRIVKAGDEILAKETDPNERRKFAWSLERFKKG